MNVLIVYSTNSGSTGAAAEVVASALKEKAHTVTAKQAFEATADELATYDLIIFGSPSWDYKGKEGQPHEEMTKLLSQLDASLSGKKYALFGLGDTSYSHFCGANEIIESVLVTKGLVKAADSLKIDRYYSQAGGPEKVKTWAEQLASTL
ncbi:flavodoxin domain-containing protein [Candidatus Gottesmanbacteria bacterium]|nr:flavodoxin domain-containing protein [Candidatus Gottesmanbacteria bacterium]